MTTIPESATRAQAKGRFGTRAWIGIISGLILLLLLGVYLIFTIGAERKFRFAIKTIRRAGEPILLEDFPPATPPTDPDTDAATHLCIAMQRLSFDSEDEKQSDALTRLPLTSEQREVLTRITDSNRAALDEVHLASTCKIAHWQMGIASLLMNNNNVSDLWNSMRKLAIIARFAAIQEHINRDDAAAVQSFFDLLALGQATRQIAPSLVSHLVGSGIEAVAADTIVELAPDLQIGIGVQDAKREELRRLIDCLLDEQNLRHSYSDGWIGGTMIVENIKRNWSTPIVESMAKLEAIRILRRLTALRDAGLQSNYPTALQLASSATTDSSSFTFLRGWEGQETIVLTQFRLLCEHRMAAVVLAVAMYRADHAGELPATLDQLVPNYLPRLPVDPFRAGGKTFGYVLTGERPAIYSVSDDGTDDHASTQPTNPHKNATIDPLARWQQKDALMYLVRLPKPEPESSDP